MRDPKLKRLKIAKNLNEVALLHLPLPQICHSPYQCKACNPMCKAANAIQSSLYWIEEVTRAIDEEERVKRGEARV